MKISSEFQKIFRRRLLIFGKKRLSEIDPPEFEWTKNDLRRNRVEFFIMKKTARERGEKER